MPWEDAGEMINHFLCCFSWRIQQQIQGVKQKDEMLESWKKKKSFCFYDDDILTISMTISIITTITVDVWYTSISLLFFIGFFFSPQACMPSFFVWMSLIMVMSPRCQCSIWQAVKQRGCGRMTRSVGDMIGCLKKGMKITTPVPFWKVERFNKWPNK